MSGPPPPPPRGSAAASCCPGGGPPRPRADDGFLGGPRRAFGVGLAEPFFFFAWESEIAMACFGFVTTGPLDEPEWSCPCPNLCISSATDLNGITSLLGDEHEVVVACAAREVPAGATLVALLAVVRVVGRHLVESSAA